MKDKSRRRHAIICLIIVNFFPSKTSALILVKLQNKESYWNKTPPSTFSWESSIILRAAFLRAAFLLALDKKVCDTLQSISWTSKKFVTFVRWKRQKVHKYWFIYVEYHQQKIYDVALPNNKLSTKFLRTKVFNTHQVSEFLHWKLIKRVKTQSGKILCEKQIT